MLTVLEAKKSRWTTIRLTINSVTVSKFATLLHCSYEGKNCYYVFNFRRRFEIRSRIYNLCCVNYCTRSRLNLSPWINV